MRFLRFIHIFFYLGIYTQNALSADKYIGILVQVKNKEFLDSKNFKELINKNNLKAERFYLTFMVQSYKLKTDAKSDLKLLCETLTKKFSEVLTCELDYVLTPGSNISHNIRIDQDINQCSPPDTALADISNFINIGLEIVKKDDCDLFNREEWKKYNHLFLNRALTPLWAQEYSGIDLLRQEMIDRSIDTSKVSERLAVWDSSDDRHGEYVANLIAGPYETSLISTSATQGVIETNKTSDFLKEYIELKRSPNRERFINNSMGWNNSSFIKRVIELLAEGQKVAFVTSAGNESTEVEEEQRKSAREGHSILVASYAPDGLSSDFTSFASEIDISAPSDNHILSYNHNGTAKFFGGTSGAAPLVTASLLGFELISGVELTTPQFKELLRKTAIRYRDDPERKVTGAGYLNTYKMGAIAFKLVELCQEFKDKIKRDACMLKALESDKLYDFSKEINKNQVINNFEAVFPGCSETISSKSAFTCDEKRKAFIELRKAAFLMPGELEIWDKLACLYSSEGLASNAYYYARLASGIRITNEEVILIPIAFADLEEFFTSNKALSNDREFILTAVETNPRALKHASQELFHNQEFVIQAVQQNGSALEYASENFRSNREVVLAAVRHDGLALEFASKRLKNDRQIVLNAVRQMGNAILSAPKKFRDDREIMFEVTKNLGGWGLLLASNNLKSDYEFALLAIKHNHDEFLHASKDLTNDREFVLAAVKQNGEVIKHVNSDFRNDREIVIAAIEQNPAAVEHASDNLKKDPIIIRAIEEAKKKSLALE